MNPRTSSQDVLRCDLCETAIVQMYCDTCFVNLCTSCVGKHFSADFSKPHKIVHIKDRRSTLIFPACTNHSDSKCESFCEDCGIELCLKCVVYGDSHKDHELRLIEDKFNAKKEAIHRDFEILTEKILPSYEYSAKYISIRRQQLDKDYDYLGNSIKKHVEELHELLDIFAFRLLHDLDEIKKIQINALKEEDEELGKKIENLKDSIDFCENLMYSNDISLVMEYAPVIQLSWQLPSNINVMYPVFQPKTLKSEELESLFGNLIPLSFTSEEICFNMKKASDVKRPTPIDWFNTLEKFTIIETEEILNVACLNEDQIWTSGRGNTLKLFNISRGSLIRSVKSQSSSIDAISVTRSGDLLYTDNWNNTVNIVKDGESKEVLRFQTWKLGRICSTCSGDFIVTLSSDVEKQSKVVCYSDSTEKQTIQFDDEGNPLFSYGENEYICENRNLDICVTDSVARAIVVVNNVGKLRFRYTGHYPVKNNLQFTPKGITTNGVSQLLVADYNNDCVHIIDQDGQFVGYIDSGLGRPWGLCTDTSDNLFVLQKGKKEEISFRELCTIL